MSIIERMRYLSAIKLIESLEGNTVRKRRVRSWESSLEALVQSECQTSRLYFHSRLFSISGLILCPSKSLYTIEKEEEGYHPVNKQGASCSN